MPPRPQTLALGLLVVLALWLVFRPSSRAPAVDSDRPKMPSGEPVYRQRLVAVGDLHGDLHNALKVLHMANLISSPLPNLPTDPEQSTSHIHWTGSGDILVQTGDIVDRGTYALDIYHLMHKLRNEALAAGGKVVSILGNHEVMNALGDWRYVTQGDISRFGGGETRREEVGVGGWLGREWLDNYSTTALVSLGPNQTSPHYSFTHGSLRPTYPNLLPYPQKINQIGHSLLKKALTPPLAPPYPPNPYSGLPKGSTAEEAEVYDSGGPFWWRGLAENRDERTVCQWAGELKRKLGVRRVIGGHTPNFERIVDRCNASIIIIDTGISSAYGGVLSALEIIYTLTPTDNNHGSTGHDRQEPFAPITHHPHGQGEDADGDVSKDASESAVGTGRTYIEREEVYAIYPHGKELITVEQQEVVR